MNFVSPDSARAELRAVDREQAPRILHSLSRFAATGEGDVRALTADWQGYFRLRVGDYRVIFAISLETIAIARVGHRGEVYR